MATQSFPFIRTRSMTQRLESATNTAAMDKGLIPPTASTRIPLSEALLNLERDGSPKKMRSFSPMRSGSFQVAPLQFERVIARPPPQEDKENPFIVTSMDPSSPGSTKKRKIPLGDQQDLELKDSPKRINITPAVEPAVDARDSELEGGEEGTESDEGLGQVQRKIEYLSLKRARDSSPPSPPSIESPDDDHLTVPDPNIDDASPRKRSRLSFLGQAPATSNADKPALPEMPHIDLSRPPPSPTRLRQPTSPTKFTGMPQLQKGALPRSPRGASLFSVALGNRLEKEKEKEVDLKPRPTFIGRVEPSLPTLPPVTFPITMNTPSTTVPDSAIDPVLLALSFPSDSAAALPDGHAQLASPPRQSAPPTATLAISIAEVASSPPPTPVRVLSPAGRLPSSRLPVRSSRIRPSTVTPLAYPPSSTQQPPRHPMQTRASGSRPVRAVRKQAPPTAFRAPPRATATATQQDILAPIKDHDHVPRDVGKVGPPARPSLSKMSSEAQTSLSNLSAALSKLSLPPPAPRSNSRLSFHEESGKREKPASQTSVRSAPATTTKNHARKPSVRNIANSFPNSQKSSTLALLANPVTVMVDAANPSMDASTSAGATPRMLSPLAGCVVFVDVRTKDGDDAGGVFVEMLKALGARVLKSPTPSLTHLVLKSPLPHTITRYHTLPDPKPEVVAVGWVVKCAEEAQRVDVADWRLDLSAGAGVVSAIPGCSTRPSTRSFVSRGGPRRISMEPRRVELLDEANLSHIALPMLELRDKVERAKRQSLLYQPKFSSPLRTNAYLANRGDEDGFEVDQA